uniref:Uncharacterized protein n=1 Tax=Meloidogyne hapla TaxID=6305 RepID=A0A1I8BTF8_MELHA
MSTELFYIKLLLGCQRHKDDPVLNDDAESKERRTDDIPSSDVEFLKLAFLLEWKIHPSSSSSGCVATTSTIKTTSTTIKTTINKLQHVYPFGPGRLKRVADVPTRVRWRMSEAEVPLLLERRRMCVADAPLEFGDGSAELISHSFWRMEEVDLCMSASFGNFMAKKSTAAVFLLHSRSPSASSHDEKELRGLNLFLGSF